MADEETLQERYCLVRDDDCHWYVIPADKRKECGEYFRKVYDYWAQPSGKIEDLPREPEWLRSIGGSPSLVTFTNPEIE
jgi:hypothetical protein